MYEPCAAVQAKISIQDWLGCQVLHEDGGAGDVFQCNGITQGVVLLMCCDGVLCGDGVARACSACMTLSERLFRLSRIHREITFFRRESVRRKRLRSHTSSIRTGVQMDLLRRPAEAEVEPARPQLRCAPLPHRGGQHAVLRHLQQPKSTARTHITVVSANISFVSSISPPWKPTTSLAHARKFS